MGKIILKYIGFTILGIVIIMLLLIGNIRLKIFGFSIFFLSLILILMYLFFDNTKTTQNRRKLIKKRLIKCLISIFLCLFILILLIGHTKLKLFGFSIICVVFIMLIIRLLIGNAETIQNKKKFIENLILKILGFSILSLVIILLVIRLLFGNSQSIFFKIYKESEHMVRPSMMDFIYKLETDYYLYRLLALTPPDYPLLFSIREIDSYVTVSNSVLFIEHSRLGIGGNIILNNKGKEYLFLDNSLASKWNKDITCENFWGYYIDLNVFNIYTSNFEYKTKQEIVNNYFKFFFINPNNEGEIFKSIDMIKSKNELDSIIEINMCNCLEIDMPKETYIETENVNFQMKDTYFLILGLELHEFKLKFQGLKLVESKSKSLGFLCREY